MRTLTKDQLKVNIFETRADLGQSVAREVSATIKKLLEEQSFVNIIFASAPSQTEFLAALLKEEVQWERINAFHMDEYVGLEKDAPQGFGNFLKERLFSKVSLHEVHYMNGNAPDPEQECTRYAALLQAHPTDIVCLGIGENTHLAFNDPHVAFFDDPAIVKVVDLDQQCRVQQVNDGCFANIDAVPAYAITITIPPLFKSTYAYAIVPGTQKAAAIYHTLKEDISEQYPSTILRNHPHAVLFIDEGSASKL